jgi:hypothetical protein
MGWMAEESEFKSRWGQDFSLHIVHTSSGADPASYPMGTRGSFAGGEADHLPPTCAKVKNTWIYTSTPPYTFMA